MPIQRIIVESDEGNYTIPGTKVTPALTAAIFASIEPPVHNFDQVQLPAAGEFALQAGHIYQATQAKQLTCTLVKTGPGPNPIIRFNGNKESAPLSVAANKTGGTRDVDFELNPGTFAVNNSGTFTGVNATIRGGGGMLKSNGSTGISRLENWLHRDVNNNYIVWVSGGTIVDTPTTYSQQPGEGFELINCVVERGTTSQHVIRSHRSKRIVIRGGKYIDEDRKEAVLRLHDVDDVTLENATFSGDISLGPMGEDNGGRNFPVGPKRAYHDAMRLTKLTATNCTFDCEAAKINPGILDFTFTNCTFSGRLGGTLFHMPWPYMDRPKSAGKFVGCTLRYRGKNNDAGRAFDTPAARERITVTNTTFNGAPLA